MGLLLKSHVATTHPSNITRLQVTKTHLQSVLERLNNIQTGSRRSVWGACRVTMVYGMKINLTWGYCNVNLAHIIEKTGKNIKKKYPMQNKEKSIA